MSQSASIEWWNKSLDEVGIHSMDKLVAADDAWGSVLQSGRDDLTRAIAITGMKCGKDRTAVEVGCVSTGPERTQTIVRAGSKFAELV